MTTNQQTIDWAKMLDQAINEPGKVNKAYRLFHGYSLRNQIWALFQCEIRGIAPGPIASFNRWKELNRFVKKGQKALSLCMPISGKRKETDDAGNETETGYQYFAIKNNWFVLSQTDGEEYEQPEIADWNETAALATLGVEKVSFEHTNGNVQGVALPGSKIAISPIAALPFKTLFHELAHILLGHITEIEALTDTDATPKNVMEIEAEAVAMLCCASLELPGVEYSRGYIQSWAKGSPISEKSAQRIFTAADKILKAGRE